MIDIVWLRTEFERKTDKIDWKEAAEDVRAFIRPMEHDGLNLWSKDYFGHKIKQLKP